MDTNSGNRTDGPLRSEFADDPAMAELLELFAAELPDRVSRLETAWQQGRFEDARRVAHQLKGAGTGYGYPRVTEVAARIESELQQLDDADETDTLAEGIIESLDELSRVCRGVVAGVTVSNK